jgi:hypothetical protein
MHLCIHFSPNNAKRRFATMTPFDHSFFGRAIQQTAFPAFPPPFQPIAP